MLQTPFIHQEIPGVKTAAAYLGGMQMVVYAKPLGVPMKQEFKKPPTGTGKPPQNLQ